MADYNCPAKRINIAGGGGHQCVDILSTLPEPLQSAIISSLPFKDAARLSCLGRVWLSSWRASKNIEFDEFFFVAHQVESSSSGGGATTDNRENQRNVFLSFVRQWIQQYQEPIALKFKLVFSHPETHFQEMEKIVQFGVEKKVKHIDLDFSDPSWQKGTKVGLKKTFIWLPTAFEGHELLESLRLFSCYIKVKDFNSFPALRTVSIGWITLIDSSIKTLLSKCPMLESLTLTNVYNIRNLQISAPRLKRLVIDKCFDPIKIYLNTPRLEYFMYSGDLIKFDFENWNVLGEVVLDFGMEETYDDDYWQALYILLYRIGHTQALTVCSYMLQVISGTQEMLEAKDEFLLPNVKHLTLKTGLSREELTGITYLLTHCTSLEVVTFEVGSARMIKGFEAPKYLEHEHLFYAAGVYRATPPCECLRKTLKVVEVKGMRGSMEELLMLKYVCRYGGVMEKVKVSMNNKDMVDYITLVLLQYGRASPNLTIDVDMVVPPLST